MHIVKKTYIYNRLSACYKCAIYTRIMQYYKVTESQLAKTKRRSNLRLVVKIERKSNKEYR